MINKYTISFMWHFLKRGVGRSGGHWFLLSSEWFDINRSLGLHQILLLNQLLGLFVKILRLFLLLNQLSYFIILRLIEFSIFVVSVCVGRLQVQQFHRRSYLLVLLIFKFTDYCRFWSNFLVWLTRWSNIIFLVVSCINIIRRRHPDLILHKPPIILWFSCCKR